MKWCFFVVLVTFAAIVKAEQDYDNEYDWDKNDEYDNYYDYDTLKELDENLSDDLGDIEDKDIKAEDEVQKVDGDSKDILASKEILDSIDDYQVEDNRDKSKDGVDEEIADENIDFAEVADTKEDAIADVENKKDDYALLWGDDSVAPEPDEKESPEEINENSPPKDETENQDDIDKILEETKNILEETDDNFDDNPKEEKIEEEPNKEIVEEAKTILESDGDEFETEAKNDEIKSQEDINKILDETKNILEETDDNFDENSKEEKIEEVPNKEIVEETKNILESDGDEFEIEAKNDEMKSQEDIDQIFEETKKILAETDDDFDDNLKENEPDKEIIEETKQILESDDDQFDPEVNEDVKTDELEDAPKIEEVLQVPKDKLVVLDPADDNADLSNDEIFIKVSDDEGNQYQNEEEDEDTVDKAQADLKKDLDQLFATLNKLTENGSDGDKSENDKTADNFSEEDANEFDDNKSDHLEKSGEVLDDDKIDKILDAIIAKDGDIKSGELDALLKDEMNKPNPEDTNVEDVETVPKEKTKSHPIAYLNDAFIDEEIDQETIEDNKSAENEEASVEETINVEDLSDGQLEELTKQFAQAHADEIDLRAPKLAEDSAPIHQTLYLDEIVSITSPGYPANYPVNNIVEWILEGDGMGIEMNITDLHINSAVGHYLLIKPGGIDATGDEGLLFAYRLNSPRKYRFFDVDRMYIKFYNMMGMPLRGFEISLKMIAPRPERDLIPEPEAVTLEPNVTARVTLALPIPEFEAVKEDFRLIIAEMIISYLAQDNLETTMDVDETTKIIHVTTCPLNWPDVERCSAVTFGTNVDVDIDLMEMWVQYNGVEPWVSSLAKLGIKDMVPPDMSMMTVWLVIAAGVVISMAMLAFVLWRYSCFDDYTRMKNYSDTDSIISEKRGLDLYPTPHQMLPPLYHDEYQIGHEATVDMSGFENKSYARETMYDFESDEEVVAPRDRNSGITPRDYTRIA